MTVGERIRNARSQKGLTQKELAERLEVTQQSIMQWENGQRNPKTSTLKRLAEALGVTYWKLAGDSENPNNEIPTIQDPGFVANMILNDVTVLEIVAKNSGGCIDSNQRNALIHDLIYRRSEQFKMSANVLREEIDRQEESSEILFLDQNDRILKEILRIINEMNLDGWLAVLQHVRELAKVSDYQKEI